MNKLPCKTCITIFLCLLSITAIITPSKAQSYFQQEINYKIDVRLDDKEHKLIANEEISYTNNSNTELTEIWMHIWPNAYKNDKSAFAQQQLVNRSTKFAYSKESERGYIEGLNFKVDGEEVDIQVNENFPDVVKLMLTKALKPGERINISTPFVVKLPNSFSRLGHVQQSYQITQWYPKPAVYDMNGWHPIPYLDQGEFYSEFGSFDVRITLPKNYVVGATGELQNEDEKLFLKQLSDKTLTIDSFKNDNTFPASSDTIKTLRYIQNNIHDFAWFADKRYHVLQSEVELPYSKRKVTTYVMFTNRYAKYWKNSSAYINDALYYYSLWLGDYPYNFCTAVDGALSAGGGMEYPMITVIGSVNSGRTLDQVITHEVGHNWFYGILGSNERQYGWMDEGINTFYESRYMKLKYPAKSMISDEDTNGFYKMLGLQSVPRGYDGYLIYQYAASKGLDQAVNTHSENFTPMNYAAVMYVKTGLLFKYLEQYLGTERFDSCMKIYYDEWKFKHPQPQDIQIVFEKVSNENLSWFFNDLLNTTEELDFKITELKKENNQYRVKVNNKSSLAAPVFIGSFDKENNLIELYKTQATTANQFLYFDAANVKKIKIDPYYVIPESNRNNNTINTKGAFKKIEKLSLRPFIGLDRPDRTELFFSPTLGYNSSDGLMYGLALHNFVFPFKNFDWLILGMYGSESKDWVGTAKMNYYLYPKFLQSLKLGASYNTYHYYSFQLATNPNTVQASRFQRYELEANAQLKKSHQNSAINKFISYKFLHTTALLNDITRASINTITSDNSSNFFSFDQLNYHRLRFTYASRVIRNPFSFNASYELGETYDSIAVPSKGIYHKLYVEFKQQINYSKSNNALHLRLFAGNIFAEDKYNGSFNYFNISGNTDYSFDRVYFNRSLASNNQFYIVDGGFKSDVLRSNVRSILALNVKADPIVKKIPLGLFADFAVASISGFNGSLNDYSDAGFYIPLIKDFVEVYIPFYNSLEQDLFLFNSKNPANNFRLMLNIPAMQPLEFIRNVSILN